MKKNRLNYQLIKDSQSLLTNLQTLLSTGIANEQWQYVERALSTIQILLQQIQQYQYNQDND